MNEINNPSRLKKLKINFPKFSMKSAEEVDLSDIDLEKLAQKPVKKRKENYPATSYKTVKEFFYRRNLITITKFSVPPFIKILMVIFNF